MINMIPASLGFVPEAMQERQGDRLQRPQQAWINAVNRSSCRTETGWSGDIDAPLRRLLKALDTFFEWQDVSAKGDDVHEGDDV
jgi:hypothetical protein